MLEQIFGCRGWFDDRFGVGNYYRQTLIGQRRKRLCALYHRRFVGSTAALGRREIGNVRLESLEVGVEVLRRFGVIKDDEQRLLQRTERERARRSMQACDEQVCLFVLQFASDESQFGVRGEQTM